MEELILRKNFKKVSWDIKDFILRKNFKWLVETYREQAYT